MSLRRASVLAQSWRPLQRCLSQLGRPAAQIAFITDVEGNYDYWDRCVQFSPALTREAGGALRLCDAEEGEQVRPPQHGGFFVYGGDVFDHGAGDLRVAAELLALKRRYPQRVHLLPGNRDVNKLRLRAELDESDLCRPLEELKAPFWMPAAARPGFTVAAFLREQIADSGTSGSESGGALTATGEALLAANTRANRLHYMLQRTMGCPRTFEHRRAELQLLRELRSGGVGESAGDGIDDRVGGVATVSDEDVVESFAASVDPCLGAGSTSSPSAGTGRAWLRQLSAVVLEYIEAAELAAVVGNTLFVHGAVTERNMGFVPSDATRWADNGDNGAGGVCLAHAGPVGTWVRALRGFRRRALAHWHRAPLWDAARRRRGGEALLAYAHRRAVANRSAMVASYVDDNGVHAAAAPPRVAAWLRASGIERVVVGHKPVGDYPLVLRAAAGPSARGGAGMPAGTREEHGVEVIMADTSYSDPSADDNRGCAAFAVTVGGASVSGPNRTTVKGVAADGAPIAYTLPPPSQAAGPGEDEHVGRSVHFRGRSDWLVRARTPGTNMHSLREGHGDDEAVESVCEAGASYVLTRNVASIGPERAEVGRAEVSAQELAVLMTSKSPNNANNTARAATTK